ncbi:L,D-transpeptidase [Cronbergia sp. UHCC 0137]|uniref:L,D-transpeptidase n=1 Tax=Cronbergia sp. UHCC 0137 TaxID=3110239 RepID=UPI002B22152C|nr:L,D-transpeptidase [Cronbergia sp. UHCC 0137]MEA5620424.1 L,D-transpeptidase [Cronbergia sp. UHCC 0137]
MKSLISPSPVRLVTMLITGAIVTLTINNPISSHVWAIPKSKTIQASIEKLQKSEERWIQINLSKQRLIAWEGKKPVYAILMSSGKKSTPTRVGTFKVQLMYKKTRMRGRGYDVPNVPHAMFYDGNYGIHGAYWHKRFGTPVSHGCVNLAPNHAKWLFDWSSIGTPVVIHK